MPYPWECIDCQEYNEYMLKNNQFWCSKMRMYVSPSERSCSTYFRQRDKRIPSVRPNTGCYLTTAMCDILGHEDNCKTLETLRGYRDNYMMSNDFGQKLLHDYDTVGPMIAEKLYEDKQKEDIAVCMLFSYIEPAVLLIKLEDYETALMLYENMTLDLMDYYDIDFDLLTAYEKKDMPKQRKRD